MIDLLLLLLLLLVVIGCVGGNSLDRRLTGVHELEISTGGGSDLFVPVLRVLALALRRGRIDPIVVHRTDRHVGRHPVIRPLTLWMLVLLIEIRAFNIQSTVEKFSSQKYPPSTRQPIQTTSTHLPVASTLTTHPNLTTIQPKNQKRNRQQTQTSFSSK
jgi:hypothetical protein